jgi:peptidoglycan/xylan/chitin deacetylase (PgdA/CDA1 family)
MIKKFLLTFLLTVSLTVPAFANDWVWEWAVLPTFEVDADTFSGGAFFSENLAAVKHNGKYGYIDRNGGVVIPFIFEKAGPFSEGLAAVSMDGYMMGFIRHMKTLTFSSTENPITEADTGLSAEAISPAPVSTASAASGEKKVAYLTIDDGPSRNNTPVILDILKANNAKATFFVLPHANMDDIYTRIINEGHELANHSFSHDMRKLYDPEDINFFAEDVFKAHEYITRKGHTPVFFRFPGGSGGRTDEVMAPRLEIIKSLGYRHFNWDVSTGDSDSGPAGKNVEALVNNVILNTQNRKKLVILMHDTADKTATVQALPIIIESLRDMGYTFETLATY